MEENRAKSYYPEALNTNVKSASIENEKKNESTEQSHSMSINPLLSLLSSNLSSMSTNDLLLKFLSGTNTQQNPMFQALSGILSQKTNEKPKEVVITDDFYEEY